jgi:steroid 5-alpha reductase family enzyme
MNLPTFSTGVQIGVIAGVSAVVMFFLYVRQLRTRDASSVDVAWSGLLGCAALFAAATGEGDPVRRALVGALGGVWGLRLALHLLVDRVLKAKEEDGRYAKLRAQWGAKAGRNFFFVFMVQALLVALLCPPFVLGASGGPAGPTALDLGAAALWVVGLAGEWVADGQLARFRRDPSNKGKVCDAGLWRFSRHPNYFFEWLMWCAFALLALSAPMGWLGLSAPALMLLLILKVSGIPPTEERSLASRGEAYREYQRTTSAFVPWFRRGAGETAR